MPITYKTQQLAMGHADGSDYTDYIGTKGELFWDPTARQLRISDGVSPGGTSINITTLIEDLAGTSALNPIWGTVEGTTSGASIIDALTEYGWVNGAARITLDVDSGHEFTLADGTAIGDKIEFICGGLTTPSDVKFTVANASVQDANGDNFTGTDIWIYPFRDTNGTYNTSSARMMATALWTSTFWVFDGGWADVGP